MSTVQHATSINAHIREQRQISRGLNSRARNGVGLRSPETCGRAIWGMWDSPQQRALSTLSQRRVLCSKISSRSLPSDHKSMGNVRVCKPPHLLALFVGRTMIPPRRAPRAPTASSEHEETADIIEPREITVLTVSRASQRFKRWRVRLQRPPSVDP